PSIVTVAARTMLNGEDLKDAMTGGRVYAVPATQSVVVEAGESAPRVETLARRGHDVQQLDALARLNVVYCKTALPTESLGKAECSARSDTGVEGTSATLLIQLE
ncbi:MAG: hypothetical protein AAF942_15190, partial [Pseudomonadota bacterium]